MSKIIYVVTSGDYSDYSIDGIFSTKLIAEIFIGNNGRGEIEEWELDGRKKDKNRTVWSCQITILEGSIITETTHKECCMEGYIYISPACGSYNIWIKSSISRKHCRKLAAETRQKILRELKEK